MLPDGTITIEWAPILQPLTDVDAVFAWASMLAGVVLQTQTAKENFGDIPDAYYNEAIKKWNRVKTTVLDFYTFVQANEDAKEEDSDALSDICALPSESDSELDPDYKLNDD